VDGVGVALGKFDFDLNGNLEHYEVQGHQLVGGALCSGAGVLNELRKRAVGFKA
jgi:hypothetical protein